MPQQNIDSARQANGRIAIAIQRIADDIPALEVEGDSVTVDFTISFTGAGAGNADADDLATAMLTAKLTSFSPRRKSTPSETPR